MTDFSNVVLKPYMKDGIIWYEYNFASLMEIYSYLKTEPELNRHVFSSHDSTRSGDFYGSSYKEALKYLLGEYSSEINDEIKNFLELKSKVEGRIVKNSSSTRIVQDIYGSFPLVSEFLKGNPKCMLRVEDVYEQKFITINCNLSYPCYTSKGAIRNRGIIILSFINALQQYGYKIKLNAFSISKEDSYSNAEILYMKVNLKKNNELLNPSYCFFPFCRREFLRRIEFRIIETTPFKVSGWASGYGGNLSESEARAYLNIPKEDKTQLYFSYPRDMGIEGDNLEEDTKHFLETVGFQKMIKANRR